jgi:hypothetical protein
VITSLIPSQPSNESHGQGDALAARFHPFPCIDSPCTFLLAPHNPAKIALVFSIPVIIVQLRR